MTNNDAHETPPIPVERAGQSTVIARLGVKMMDDRVLKSLAQAIEQSAGADKGVTVVVLDMARVQIVPSLALGLILQISKTCRINHQRLKLASVMPQVRQVFSITRLDRLLEFTDTVESAVE
jgi:anti-anti-sigma factor